ncbi:MAG: hypothetical protein KC478_17325 [Bacteriovoracaceae bacterium]|nr:hypothetical protein [Bacteriovoracaceae bacterium]
MFKNILTLILLTLLTFVNGAKAKVDPKNYDFTYDKFRVFYPGQKLSDIKEKYKNLKLINKKGSVETYEATITHVRYVFPLYVQIKNELVIDFYAKLPNYFIHDIFHQSLINRFGKQNQFLHKDGTSFYVWKDAGGITITYSGACTITCFPIFIHGIGNKEKALQKESLLIKLNKSSKGEFVN